MQEDDRQASERGRRLAWAASNLAASLLAGPWTLEAIEAAVAAVLGPARRADRQTLVAALADLAEDRFRPAPHQLAAWLRASPSFRPRLDHPIAAELAPPRFTPIAAFAGLAIPPLATPADLAAWLDLSIGQLDWLADERRGHARVDRSALQHYRYAIVAKPSGGLRILESPKPRLKAIQRRILDGMLAPVPVHAAAHGFVRGRSCLTNARVHASEAIVASFDLARFFTSLDAPRVHGLFRNLGYPWAVARRLTGLTTTVTPRSLLARLALDLAEARDLRAVHFRPHLPQGAPTSPALANLMAWPLDRRVHGLADAMGASYTRYADDLAISGDAAFAARIGGFRKTIETIIEEEGFAINAGKTRLMRRGSRQRVTGITVNAHCNIDRGTFDALKATLFNCVRFGPESQNHGRVADFRRHLDGRIAWVEHVAPRRGARLRMAFDRIDWGGLATPR